MRDGRVRTAAIIAAGGFGKRFGGEQKKQFVTLLGKPILLWSLHPFLSSAIIDEIVVVVPAEDLEFFREEILQSQRLQKPVIYTAGGKYRQESVLNGLRQASPDADIILIHDAVRPFITGAMLINGIDACRENGAAIYAVPETDTVIEVENQKIKGIIDRNYIWRVQTPQIFHRDLIVSALQKAQAEGFVGTDESALVRRLGHPVHVLQGSYDNIKITIPEDLAFAELIIKRRKEFLF